MTSGRNVPTGRDEKRKAVSDSDTALSIFLPVFSCAAPRCGLYFSRNTRPDMPYNARDSIAIAARSGGSCVRNCVHVSVYNWFYQALTGRTKTAETVEI